RLFLAAAGAAGAAMTLPAYAGRRGDQFLAHEWGTFTTLQDEDGKELHGINIDDEPVPDFVHNLNPFLLSKPLLSSRHWQYRQKAAPRHHPLVSMRLETPVIYFYPPKGLLEAMTVDVRVEFRGGWLTEFYPNATPHAAGLKDGQFDFGNLNADTLGSLTWSDLAVGNDVAGPQTDAHVWLAPRKVESAAGITNQEGESEKYLFYRGVGCQQAPLRITLDRQARKIAIHSRMSPALVGEQQANFATLWVAHVKPDGTSAFRILAGFAATRDDKPVLREASYRFEKGDYSTDNKERLHQAMHAALVADGLFADEATALLSTWQRAYFTSPGLRVFYLVPRSWTDFYLPISITPRPELVRTMMGRIELVSDEQRQILGQLADLPIGKGEWVYEIPASPALEKFLAGRADFGDLGVPIPKEYQLYMQLGRFRNALVTAEEARRPSPSLTQFINAYHLHPFRVKR
ncbi:MAG: hypothetical protein WEH44_07795, partial [Pirellulaceae bacterium]